MKKTYTAPVMLTENFRLSDRIAAGCTDIVALRDGYTCTTKDEYGMEGSGVRVFASSNGECWIWYDVDNPPEDLPCYHAPTGVGKYFTS